MENKETLIEYFLPCNESLHPSRQRGSFSTFKKRNCRPELNELTVVLQGVKETPLDLAWFIICNISNRRTTRNLQIHSWLFVMVCVCVRDQNSFSGQAFVSLLTRASLWSCQASWQYRIIRPNSCTQPSLLRWFQQLCLSFGLEVKTLMFTVSYHKKQNRLCP